MWEHSSDSSSLDIGFYGGEPLIAIDLIKKVVDYSEKLFVGKEIGFTITTNATLISEDIIHYFKEHNVKLMISLDGPKDINDENRVFRNGNGSYDIVMKNIKLIYKVEPEYAKKLQISMVLNPEHDFECFNRLYKEDEMFRQLSTISSIVDKDYDDVAAKISEEYLWKARYQNFLVLLSYLGRIHKDKLSPIVSMSKFSDIERRLDIPMGNRLFPVDTAGGSCIPGQIRLFCTVDGNLLPCERVSESSNACRIGTLEEGFDINKAKEFLNIGKLTEDVCRKCWCIRFCSMCGKMADSGKDTLDPEHKLKLCKNEHAAAEDKIKLYLLIKEINQYHVNNSCLKGDD
ncbi:MAG: radical SAM protein [Peptoanaerobacter stomatis]|uniref:radical SAM protein n=1 Tax=Clostridia TaxID=186801 RepID=UPI003FA0D0BB